MGKHYFLAIPVPERFKESLYVTKENMLTDYPFKHWTHPLDYHITLIFLGELDEMKLQLVKEIVELSIEQEEALFVRLKDIRIFGEVARPRVVYHHVKLDAGWLWLRNRIFTNLKPFFRTLDARPYRPHVTYAKRYVGGAAFPFEQREVPDWCMQERKWYARDMVLYSIQLNETPRYVPIAKWDVGA
ncbi:MAG: RNA 2',3'-cyclic phosphodiesterase [Bacilli bacterium]